MLDNIESITASKQLTEDIDEALEKLYCYTLDDQRRASPRRAKQCSESARVSVESTS